MVGLLPAAEVARAAGEIGVDGDPLAALEPGDVWPYLDDLPGELVAGDQGIGYRVALVSPTLVGTYDIEVLSYRLVISGTFAYLTDHLASSGIDLHIVDLTDPTHPQKIGQLSSLGAIYALAISGTNAYLADYFSGLYTVDISDWFGLADSEFHLEISRSRPKADFGGCGIMGLAARQARY